MVLNKRHLDNKSLTLGISLDMHPEKHFIPLNLAILVVSDTRTEADDVSGNTLAELATLAGHSIIAKKIVPDNIYHIRAAIANWLIDGAVNVIISTGVTAHLKRCCRYWIRSWRGLAKPLGCCLTKRLKPPLSNRGRLQGWLTAFMCFACPVPPERAAQPGTA
jgi:hypothetical protein